MRKYRLEQRRTGIRRIIATILAVVYLCGSEGPMLLAFAAPSWFVRPGAGVSSQPLGVSSFGAPGFGDLAQAVNLANGNVYAAAGGLSFNNQSVTGDERTNTVGSSGWNLTQRLRLNGFSRTSNANFGLDNLIFQQQPRYSDGQNMAMPNVLPVSRMLTADSPSGPASGCGNGSQSGLMTNAANLTPGKYRLTLDARADAPLQILYGLNNNSINTTANLTTSWQSFTMDFTVTSANAAQSVPMAIWEATLGNPAWEVANLRSFQLDWANNPTGANLVTNQDLRSANYGPVCARPITESIWRLQSRDGGSGFSYGPNKSGVRYSDSGSSPIGTYRVSVQARTRNGSLPVLYGIGDTFGTAATLTTSWQTLSQTYSNAYGDFQISENIANNPDWEIRNISVQRIAPGNFTLSSGEGNSRLFKQTTPTFNTNFERIPEWISRYKTTPGTTFYRLEPLTNTQYAREWIVLRQIGANYIAHYYTADGSRVSFNDDGEYADFVQNPHQQLRGANATTGADPEGIAATTPKTEISYTALNSGLISKVRDEWGRITTYEWNTTDRTLSQVNELLRTESDNASAARKTLFEYGYCFGGACGNQRAITKMTQIAPDGKTATGVISRVTQFDYLWLQNNSRLVLRQVRRGTLDGSATRDTTYEYDGDNRISKIYQTGEPTVQYTWSMTGTVYLRNGNLGEVTLTPKRVGAEFQYLVPQNFATDLYEVRLLPTRSGLLEWNRNGQPAKAVRVQAGQRATLGRFNVRPGDLLELKAGQGARVKLIPLLAAPGPATTYVRIVQGGDTDPNRKESKFYFNGYNQLYKKEVRDYNPWIPAATGYTFSTAEKWLTTLYSYQSSGSTESVISPSGRKDVYSYDERGNIEKVETFSAANATTPERSQTFQYDTDNRSTGDTIEATSGTRDAAAYSYLENKKVSSYTFYSATVGTQTFRAISRFDTARYVGGALKRGMTMDYDASGRLAAKSTTYGSVTGVNTTFTYHTGTDYNEWVQEPTEAQTTPAKQYGDLIASSNDGRGLVKYNYNRFGDLIYKTVTAGLASDIDAANTFTTDRGTRKDVNTMRGYNGFGQMVFEKLGEPGRTASERRMTYYANGELDSSWEGQVGNTTKYAYAQSGANLGRVTTITKGEGNGSSVTTPHETTVLAYDAFGRVVTQTVDAQPTSTTILYDTLDRAVSTTMPNGNVTRVSYHPSGTQEYSCDLALGGSGTVQPAQPDAERCTYNNNIDALGRIGNTEIKTKNAVIGQSFFTYDPYDRLIKVRNDALTMVPAGDARATLMVYDTEGNLVKQLGPELGNSGYADNRRPYMEYEYDGFNRKIRERRLTRSSIPVAASSPTMPGDATDTNGGQAVSEWTYDVWDRVASSSDAGKYRTNFGYDPLGNLAQRSQEVCKSGDATCLLNFSDEDDQKTDRFATTRYAYDAVGRMTLTVDARGDPSRVRYNPLGLPSSVMDARGVTTKVMRYTPDGLPSAQWEPDNSLTTSAVYIEADDYISPPGNYVMTKRWQYGSARKYPTSMDVANMNTAASAGAVYTTYQYDFAGRPTLTTLPLNGTIEQSYDGRGNLTRLKDADGFVTEYKFGAWGQLLEEKKKRRDGTVDMTALPGDLVSTYTYDQAGNLATKLERGLLTEYAYNSLGKVKAETRPRVPGVAVNWKYYTYRVDGAKTAETTYDYAGTLTSSGFNTVDCEVNQPNITVGNVQCWQPDARGLSVVSGSVGIFGNSGAVIERRQYDDFNGLANRYKRNFFGISNIYANYTKGTGENIIAANYTTYWRYDANGNLLKSYKRGGGDTSATVSTLVDDSETHEYTFSPTNKELSRSSRIRTWISAQSQPANIEVASTGDGTTQPVRCTGCATAQSTTSVGAPGGKGGFNERDQMINVVVTDRDARGVEVARRTYYEYYLDGSKSRTVVYNPFTDPNTYIAEQTYSYDTRGRLQTNFDSNDAATTTSTYAADGSVTQSLNTGNYTTTRTPTVGGLTGAIIASAKPGFNGCPADVTACTAQNSTITYSADGVTQNVKYDSSILVNGVTTSTTKNTTYEYDGYGNNTTQKLDGTTVYTAAYTVNNALNTETITPSQPDQNGNSAPITRSYTLSSRGMRLSMTGSDSQNPLINASKRYDADDRAAEFKVTYGEGELKEFLCLPICNIYLGSKGAEYRAQRVMFMRYDPAGNLVLSASATYRENFWGGVFYNDLESKANSSVFLDGSVHFMRSTAYALKHRIDRTLGGVYVGGFTLLPPVTATADRDETFGLTDGVRNEDPNFSLFTPFSATPTVNSSATPLQAPITPLSSQVRVEPSAIQAPGSPLPSSDPSAITAPSSAAQPSTTAAPQAGTGFSSGTSLSNTTNTTVSSQAVSAPTVGVQSFSVSNATTTVASSSTTQPAPSTKPVSSQPTQQFSSRINLEPPSSVLPPSITPLSASSIVAPSGFNVVVPASGDVSSIVAPGGSRVPTVGATPSSGTGTIVPPSSSVVPPSGSSGGIVRPGGGSSVGGVKPLGYGQDANGTCFDYGAWNYRGWEECNDPKQLDDFKKKQDLEWKLRTDPGNVKTEAQLEFIDTRIMAGTACANNATGDKGAARDECRLNISLMQESDFYKELQPVQRLHFWQLTQGGLQSGYIGRDEIQQMTRLAKRCTLSGGELTCNSPAYLDAMGNRPRARLTIAPLVVLALPVLAVGLGVFAIFAIASQAKSVVLDGQAFQTPAMPKLRLELPWLSGIPLLGGSGATIPWGTVNNALNGVLRASDGDDSDANEVSSDVVDDYLAGTTPVRVGDKSDQREMPGGAAQAEEDFGKLVDPSSIRTTPQGVRIGVTPSGQTVVLYPASEGSPTIAFPGKGEGGKQLKVRYR